MEFQVMDHVRMKRNLRKIDTYGISPHILKEHRRTVFKVRQVIEKKGNEGAIRFYGELSLAYWNPEMFEKVENVEELKWKEKCCLVAIQRVWKNWLRSILRTI